MRDHSECDAAINAQLARGNEGHAEFLATRCDQSHGVLANQPNPDATAGDDNEAAPCGEEAL